MPSRILWGGVTKMNWRARNAAMTSRGFCGDSVVGLAGSGFWCGNLASGRTVDDVEAWPGTD